MLRKVYRDELLVPACAYHWPCKSTAHAAHPTQMNADAGR